MKRASEILEFLVRSDAPRAVLVAPNAPPVARSATGIEVAMNLVLDGSDIYDTIKALHIMSGAREDEPLRESGSFSFAVADVGRFRVHYATQRGTKVARVAVIPFSVPSLAECCANPDTASRLLELATSGRPGLLAVVGPGATDNNTLVYGLLREINQSRRLIIYAVERTLTYLIAHGDSIVIQTELGADVIDFEHGVSNALVFDPNILFVGDVRPTDQIPSLGHAVGSGIFGIVSSVSVPAQTLLRQYLPPLDANAAAGGVPMARLTALVSPQPNNRFDVQVVE